MSSGAANNPDPNAENALLRRPYDPTTQGTAGQFLNKLTIPVPGFQDKQTGNSYAVVRLTAKGDRTLFDLYHNNVQREVWRFPSYELVARVGALTVKQVRTARPSYDNAILIAHVASRLVSLAL